MNNFLHLLIPIYYHMQNLLLALSLNYNLVTCLEIFTLHLSQDPMYFSIEQWLRG